MDQRAALPKVSVVCTCYNNANFLRETYAGIVRQKVDFPVEIILHDDASNDGTRAILESLDPHDGFQLRTVVQSENQFALGKNPWLDLAFPFIRGQYVAFCEGDDVWIDPLKLAAQVEFLDGNPGFDMVHTGFRTEFLDRSGALVDDKEDCSAATRTTFEDLLWGHEHVGTLTVCLRSSTLLAAAQVIGSSVRQRRWRMTDYPLWLEVASHGPIGYLPLVTANYRHRKGSLSHPYEVSAMIDFIESVWDVRQTYRGRMGLEPKGLDMKDRVSLLLAERFDSFSGARAFFRAYHRLRLRWGARRRSTGIV